MLTCKIKPIYLFRKTQKTVEFNAFGKDSNCSTEIIFNLIMLGVIYYQAHIMWKGKKRQGDGSRKPNALMICITTDKRL